MGTVLSDLSTGKQMCLTPATTGMLRFFAGPYVESRFNLFGAHIDSLVSRIKVHRLEPCLLCWTSLAAKQAGALVVRQNQRPKTEVLIQ
jgi:hypothetical protein